MKYCVFCKKDLPLDDFHKNKLFKDGRNNKCKLCVKKYQQENSERIKQKNKEWHKNNKDHCLEIRRNYYKNTIDARKAEGKRSYEKSKNTTRKKYLEENAEKIKEKRRQYRLNNKDKNMKYRLEHKHNIKNAGTFSMQDWCIIQELYDFQCIYCQANIKNSASIDHFIPLSKGGKNTIENIVPSCIECNQSKHAHNPFEWYKRKFGKELIKPSHIVLDSY